MNVRELEAGREIGMVKSVPLVICRSALQAIEAEQWSRRRDPDELGEWRLRQPQQGLNAAGINDGG
jgi:hypothetical protein